MRRWQIAITLGIVCCVLTLAISIQLKTIDSSNETVSLTLTSNDLRDQVLKNKEKYDKALKDLDKSEAKLEEVRLQATQNDSNALEMQNKIKQANTILGRTNVKGEGIIIKLSDNNAVTRNNISPYDNIELYLVHAGDLVMVINDLKNAGAEAISINGQRVVDSSAIYCAGNVIKINGEKISSPMEIKAIGEKDLLYGSMTIPGGYIELLKETGVVVDIKKSTDIQINKYEGKVSTDNMHNQ